MLVVPSESQAGMDGMVSVLFDVDAAGAGPRIEPRDGFFDLKTFFLEVRFISS